MNETWLEGSNCGLSHENYPELRLKSGTELTKDPNIPTTWPSFKHNVSLFVVFVNARTFTCFWGKLPT